MFMSSLSLSKTYWSAFFLKLWPKKSIDNIFTINSFKYKSSIMYKQEKDKLLKVNKEV